MVLKVNIHRYAGSDASVLSLKKKKEKIFQVFKFIFIDIITSFSFDNFFQWAAANLCDHS